MLFQEQKYLDYQFPEPQYLGAKYIHRSWINKYIPDGVKVAFDAFGGSQSIAYLFKQKGIRTLTNDFMAFNNQIGIALIENKDQILTEEDVKLLFSPNPDTEKYNLIESLYTDLFFERKEAQIIDAFRGNIERLENKYKKALAIAIMNRSMTRKVTMGHFAHTQALIYASSPDRIKRNRSLIRPIRDIFLDLYPQYNQAVFDNHKENESYNQNTLDLIPQLDDIDLVYFDPPYCNSHADYQSFYHLLETFTEYWKEKKFVNGTKRYEPKRYSGFDKKATAIRSIEYLLASAKHIPYWIISYNDRSYPDIKTFSDIISQFKKDIKIEHKEYENGRGGKGSVAGSSEVLLICK